MPERMPGAFWRYTYLKVLLNLCEISILLGVAPATSTQDAGSTASAPARRVRVVPDGAATRRLRHRLALGWQPPEKLDRAGWLAAGTSLAEFGRVNNWWLGDWVRYGTSRWGEKYIEAARITGLDGKTLRNIAYVSSRFDLSRRRDNLTWTHHAEVAALAPDLQDQWLERSLALRFSPGDLRLELRSAQRPGGSAEGPLGDSSAGDGVGEPVACPHCGGVIPASDIRRLSATGRSRHSRRSAAR
jgi:hypothetical protein